MSEALSVSLIVTTYNWPEALKCVLESVLRQSRLPDEVIIADDGSTEATASLIADFQARFPVPLIHSWQEDKGFRVAMSRNKAIAKAKGDYIVLIDGDLVLQRHFIADHLKAAARGHFVSGKRARMTAALSDKVIKTGLVPSVFSKGLYRGRSTALRFAWLSRQVAMSKCSSADSIHACNLAFWRADALAINGFNIGFEGWGPEDKEFAARLLHLGLKRKVLKFAGVAFHLYHKENCKAALEKNNLLFEACLAERKVRCDQGLHECVNEHPAPTSAADQRCQLSA